jgi:tetratricopeptide (TPR) repeat protein
MKLAGVTFFLLLMHLQVAAQNTDTWPSPEVEQIYRQACTYLAAGDLSNAVVTYKQTILLAPDKMVLYRDLGQCYYLQGNYKDAEQALQPLLNNKDADAQTYQLMAACYTAEDKKKEAKAILQTGFEKFPNSGLLYHEQGNLLTAEKKEADALLSWLAGIEKDPAYRMNYYEAARTYLNTDRVLWGLLYGEIFVNMERETTRSLEMRKMMMAGYKKMFDNLVPKAVPQFGKAADSVAVTSFKDAIDDINKKLTPVVSDGITVENLTMVRTRFIIDWSKLASKYPFTLFAYQDTLLKYGYFDVYNEWLFGKAESEKEYQSWTKFHDKDMEKLKKYFQAHPLQVAPSDFYNDKNMDGLFDKKKEK